MSQNDGNHESVEEAVFKYVGVGLGKSGEEDSVNKQKSVDWFLKEQDHEHEDEQDREQEQGPDQERDDDSKHRDANDVSAVAAAAVAAALSVKKRARTSEQLSGKVNATGQAAKKPKKNKTKLHLAAVDPELASLDDNLVDSNDPEEQSHHQLVHKAIMDTDNIASQHPDFQQYLNTEDDQEPKKEKAHERSYDELSNIDDDHMDDVSVSSSVPSQVKLKKTAEVLPKVLSSETHASNHQDDVSSLIQEAAAKASHIINPATQSNGKSFDESEEEALEQFIKEYQKIRGLSRRQICERIWSNERRKDDFWTNICRVLPYRTRSSIYKHVRRKYHIFEQRGKWTPEEDAELARWCAEKEGQWSNIGKVLGRMPEDCRDRWRNYVKCGPNRAANKWSPEEEEKLKSVIHQMLENASAAYEDGEVEGDDAEEEENDIKESSAKVEGSDSSDMLNVQSSEKKSLSTKSKKKPAPKDIINWTVVSEQMGGTRSRIQCRYKWNKLLKKEALNKIKNISEDDKFWLLTKLRDMGFTEDSQVDWEELSTLMPGRRWTGTELKLLYEKVRTSVRQYKRKTINVICKELVGYPETSMPLNNGIHQHDSPVDDEKD